MNIEQGISNIEFPLSNRNVPSTFNMPCSIFEIQFPIFLPKINAK